MRWSEEELVLHSLTTSSCLNASPLFSQPPLSSLPATFSLANILSLFKNNWGWNKRVNCMWFRNEVGCQWIANWLHSTWEPLQEWSCLPRVMIRWSILLFIDWNEETLIFEFKNCSFQEGLHCIHFRTGQHIDFKSSQVESSLASRRFNIVQSLGSKSTSKSCNWPQVDGIGGWKEGWEGGEVGRWRKAVPHPGNPPRPQMSLPA